MAAFIAACMAGFEAGFEAAGLFKTRPPMTNWLPDWLILKVMTDNGKRSNIKGQVRINRAIDREDLRFLRGIP